MPILSFLRVKPSCGLRFFTRYHVFRSLWCPWGNWGNFSWFTQHDFSRVITFLVRFTIPEEIEGTTRSLPRYDFSRVIAFFVRFAIPEETEVHLVYLNARVYSRYRDQPYLEKRSETGYPARVYYEIPRDRFRKIKLDLRVRYGEQYKNKTKLILKCRSNIGPNSLESVVLSHFHRETTCIIELCSVTLRKKRAITKYLPNMTFSLAVCCFIFLLTKFSCCWDSLFFGSILSTSSKSFFARSSSLIDNLAW